MIAADGKVGAPAPWPADDWGTWRDDTDAKVQLDGARSTRTARRWPNSNQQLVDGYAELQASTRIRRRRSKQPLRRARTRTTRPRTGRAARRRRDDRCIVLARCAPRGADVGVRVARRARDGSLRSPSEGSRGEVDSRRAARRCGGPVAEALRGDRGRVLRAAPHAVLHPPSAGPHARAARRHRGAGVLREGRAARDRSGDRPRAR